MLHVIGKENLVKNAILLARLEEKSRLEARLGNIGDRPSIDSSIAEKSKLNAKNLRHYYLSYLSSKQKDNPVCFNSNAQWIFKYRDVNPYVRVFEGKSSLDDLNQDIAIDLELYDEDDAREKIFTTRAALDELRNIMPDYYDLFQLNIHTIFAAPSAVAGGGSTSNMIGAIWANPRKHWAKKDVMELLIHEFTHNTMFVDELCHQHYRELKLLSNEENYSLSSILKKSRPLDKVIHALVVSTEILAVRHFCLGHPSDPKAHPPTHLLLEQTKASIQNLKELKRFDFLLKNRAKELIEICQNLINHIELDYKERYVA